MSRRQPRSLLAALLLGAPRNTLSRQASTWSGAWSGRSWSLRFPLAYALWRELRSLPCRILEIHERELAEEGLSLGAPMRTLSPGLYEEDVLYPARSEGIRNLRRVRPWSTILDGLLFLEGIEWAAKYLSCNCRIPKRLALAQSSPASMAADATPPEATLQGLRRE